MWRGLPILLFCLALVGCWLPTGPEVVVYSALDRPFAEPILNAFEEQMGVQVRTNFDIESTKTVGLVNKIIQERSRPRCDVFWNNEILHTYRLQKLGLLATYLSPAAGVYPARYVSADGYWHGFAARARVLVVNTEVLPDREQWPTSVEDLADPRWKGQAAIAKPLFGTTASHGAALFAHWGDERAMDFFRRLKSNVDVLSGNKQVAEAVARRQFAFGLTDTDDAVIEQDEGRNVAIVYPDQHEDGMGTLLIPNTLCLIKNSPNPERARRLVDYLLSAEVEGRLAEGHSAQFPLNPLVEVQPRVTPTSPVRWMQVDFDAAAEKWDVSREFLAEQFASAD